MKLSTGQIVIIAGAGLALYVLAQRARATGSPFLGGLLTAMPESATPAERAAWFARTGGRYPDVAGTNGTGATAVQPAYAGLLAGMGTAVTSLFQKIAGPGNAAPASRPQASASSGGGISQPNLATSYTPLFDQSSVYFGQFDNSFGDFGSEEDFAAYQAGYRSDYAPAQPYVMTEQIVSDQGTYDVASGTWS